jgi:hypothetical protein
MNKFFELKIIEMTRLKFETVFLKEKEKKMKKEE